MPGVAEIIAGLFKPAADLIDNLTTTKEEKMKAEAVLYEIQTGTMEKMIEYHSQLVEAQSAVIIAEAQGESWLQRNWRPIIMLMFGFIIFNNYVLVAYFNVPHVEVPPDMWKLITIGLGGYVVGRSIEKTVRYNKNS